MLPLRKPAAQTSEESRPRARRTVCAWRSAVVMTSASRVSTAP